MKKTALTLATLVMAGALLSGCASSEKREYVNGKPKVDRSRLIATEEAKAVARGEKRTRSSAASTKKSAPTGFTPSVRPWLKSKRLPRKTGYTPNGKCLKPNRPEKAKVFRTPCVPYDIRKVFFGRPFCLRHKT